MKYNNVEELTYIREDSKNHKLKIVYDHDGECSKTADIELSGFIAFRVFNNSTKICTFTSRGRLYFLFDYIVNIELNNDGVFNKKTYIDIVKVRCKDGD